MTLQQSTGTLAMAPTAPQSAKFEELTFKISEAAPLRPIPIELKARFTELPNSPEYNGGRIITECKSKGVSTSLDGISESTLLADSFSSDAERIRNMATNPLATAECYLNVIKTGDATLMAALFEYRSPERIPLAVAQAVTEDPTIISRLTGCSAEWRETVTKLLNRCDRQTEASRLARQKNAHLTKAIAACDLAGINSALDNGANINGASEGCFRISIAQLAILADSSEVLELLLNRGCNLSQITRAGDQSQDALSFAVYEDKKNSVSFLHKNRLCSDRDPATSIFNSARSAMMVEHLVKLGYGNELNRPDSLGRTALLIKCEDGACDVVAALIKAGAARNATDSHGMSEVHYAVRSFWRALHNTQHSGLLIDSINVIAVLANNGANFHHRDNYGLTPFDGREQFDRQTQRELWMPLEYIRDAAAHTLATVYHDLKVKPIPLDAKSFYASHMMVEFPNATERDLDLARHLLDSSGDFKVSRAGMALFILSKAAKHLHADPRGLAVERMLYRWSRDGVEPNIPRL